MLEIAKHNGRARVSLCADDGKFLGPKSAILDFLVFFAVPLRPGLAHHAVVAAQRVEHAHHARGSVPDEVDNDNIDRERKNRFQTRWCNR